MKATDRGKLDPAEVAALYVQHGEQLRAFVAGVLRDGPLAQDVLQATFVKAVEQGHRVELEAMKSWLFRVAFHEALAARRRQGVRQRGQQRLADAAAQAAPPAVELAVTRETVERVRAAIGELPREQRRIVQMRIYGQETFATIAARLGVPLSTVLTRMQRALAKLRASLGDES